MNKSNKARLVVYSDLEEAEFARIDAALSRTPTERFDFLMRLIKLSFMLKGDFSKDISGYKYIIRVKQKTDGDI
jgi:hypothetical protein